VITIKNTTNAANGPRLQFVHDKGAAGADNDLCGQIEFIGDDDNQDNIAFAKISGQVADASNGDECGKLNLLVAENDGNLTAGLVLTGSTTDGEVDVTVGAGAASVTTVAGLMTVTGIATLASSSTVGNLTLANGSITDSSGAISFGNENLTTTGTVGIGTSTTDPTGWGAGYTVPTVGSATSGSVLNLQNSSTSLSNNARVGTLDFVAGGGSPAPIARVEASVAGTSEAGGWLNFYVRPDGGSLTEAMRIDSAGNVGIGGLHGSPSVFEVWGGEASASTPTLKVADGVVSVGAANNDANVVFTVEDRLGSDYFIADTANSRVQMPRGNVYIGLDTSNSYMTQGITINQAANDNEILAFKSTGSVSHNMSDLTEADTWGTVKKRQGAAGGMKLSGYSDTTIGLSLQAFENSVDTTKGTGGTGAIELLAGLRSGIGATDPSSDANMVVIRTNAGTTRFIFDVEGTGHADVAWTTYDRHDDIAIINDMEAELLAHEDEAKTDRRHALEELGVIGKGSWHMEHGKPRAMVNFTKLSMLHHGALIQIGQAYEDLKTRLALAENKLAQLTA